MTKNILAAASIALFILSPAAFAQSSADDTADDAAVASGDAAGSDEAQVRSHAALAGVSTAALIGGAFLLADGDDEDVDLGGTGTTGTTGTTGPTGPTGTTGTTGTVN